jgi:hypothetical protein
VGHGPSLLQKRLGEWIDSFDFVIRQKRCQETLKHPDIYGTRKDAVCGSLSIAPALSLVGAEEIWVFMDSRHAHVSDEQVEEFQKEWRIDRELCDNWNARYRARRTPYEKHEQMREFDSIGHPHLSAGFHTLIYASEFLKPKTIALAGFDNVRNGSFTWSITRGPDWRNYPDHRWDIENKMVSDIEDQFGVEINFA